MAAFQVLAPPTVPPPTLPCHPAGDSQSSSPTPAVTSRLPFDIGSIFRRAAAAVDATAAPAAPAEEDEDALAARVAAQAVANAVAANTPAGQQQQQPRGLPGLPGRPAPRGGLPGLPPRPGLAGAGLPARPSGQQQGGEEEGAAAAPAAGAAAPAAPAGPAGLGAPRQQPMLFRRAQPEGEAGGAPAAPAAPPMPTSVVSEGDDDKVRRGAKEGCGKRACRCAICCASAGRAATCQLVACRMGCATPCPAAAAAAAAGPLVRHFAEIVPVLPLSLDRRLAR